MLKFLILLIDGMIMGENFSKDHTKKATYWI